MVLPSDRFVDYGPVDNQYMVKKADEFLEIFTEVSKKIQTRKLVKLKVPPDEVDNSIWIDPSIRREFLELQNAEMPIRKIFDIYDRWFEQLYRLTTINEQRLHRKKISNHMTEILIICSSFHEALKRASEGLPRPPGAS